MLFLMVAEICRYSVSENKNLSADTPVFHQSEFRIWFGLVCACPIRSDHVIFTFWYVKGNIPNEKIRLPPLEVHFGIGGCGRTVSARGNGQE